MYKRVVPIQEESRSISENTTRVKRNSLADGTVSSAGVATAISVADGLGNRVDNTDPYQKNTINNNTPAKKVYLVGCDSIMDYFNELLKKS